MISYCLLLVIFQILFFLSSTSSQRNDSLTLPIEGKLLFPSGSSNFHNYRITLNGNQYTTINRVDGSFIFHEIPSGVYLLDVSSVKEIFPQMKIKVNAEGGEIFVVEYKYPGAPKIKAPYPIVLIALTPVNYFQVKQPFSLWGMIMGNPMIIVMMFTMAIVLVFPKVLENLSPEELKELQAKSAATGSAQDPMKSLNKIMGMGGKDDDDDE
eukprot:gene15793-21389_t